MPNSHERRFAGFPLLTCNAHLRQRKPSLFSPLIVFNHFSLSITQATTSHNHNLLRLHPLIHRNPSIPPPWASHSTQSYRAHLKFRSFSTNIRLKRCTPSYITPTHSLQAPPQPALNINTQTKVPPGPYPLSLQPPSRQTQQAEPFANSKGQC